MFGYQGGESTETVARKRGSMKGAQARWPFMTRYDLTTIHNEAQLTTLVRDRLGLSRPAADAEVALWLDGKSF